MFLVCGEALFDLFPENTTATSTVKFDGRAGGSPFNVAVGLARLNVPTAILTGISSDMLGEKLAAALVEEGVSTKYLVRSGRRTTLSLVGLNQSGSATYAFYGIGSADCGVKYKHLPEIKDEPAGYHFGSYTTVIKPVAKAFIKLARNKKNKFISYDPNVRLTIEPDIAVWRKSVHDFSGCADVIKISSEDFELLHPNELPEAKAQEWFDQGVKLIILTNGSRQVSAWSRSGLKVNVKPPKTTVIDTVGAGDTFQAAMLKCLLELENPKEDLNDLNEQFLSSVLNYAATAAALTCTRRGADLPRLTELDAIMGDI
ncbi:MAG: carbohydrate kinase [Gammaproteobacteria bacterium]|nr:carbohydrate kinase [Gammaproteobacteria bacterium]